MPAEMGCAETMPNKQDVYRSIWKPKLEREGAEGPYRGGNLRVDLAVSQLPPGERLLDVGCGSGTLGGVLLAEGRYAEVHGLEISGEAVERARERGVRAQVFNLNRGPFPHPDGSFDAVTCLAVIEHVLDPRPVLDEIARVLKPRGLLVLDTPNIRYLKHLWSLLARGRFPVTSGDDEDRRLAYDGGHMHYFTHRDIAALLRERGLRVVHSPCVLAPRLRAGALGGAAGILCRLPVFDELLSAEIFVVARKVG